MRDYYAELVNDLRNMQSTEYCAIASATDFPAIRIVQDAADAIEELQAGREHYKAAYIAEHDARIEEIKRHKWISVKERLPETDDFVIVAVLDERGDTPYQYTDFGWYLDAARCWIVNAEQRRDITHWMPLPEPPMEDAK